LLYRSGLLYEVYSEFAATLARLEVEEAIKVAAQKAQKRSPFKRCLKTEVKWEARSIFNC
jgi:hypothetical protein